jgi:WD40 repeat protein
MTGHAGTVHGLAYSRDGGRLASVSDDKTLRFWDPATGRAIGAPVELSEKAWSLATSPDGRQLAIACGDWSRADTPGIVEIRDSGDGHLLHRMEGHKRIAWGVAYHPRGAWLASSGGETHLPGDILLWDSTTGRRLQSLPEVPEGLVSLALDPDGNMLATGSLSGTIRLWDAKRGQLVWARQAHDGLASCLRFSASGAELLSAGEDGRVKLLDARDGAEVLRLPDHMHCVECAIYSRDGRRIATSSFDGRIQICDTSSGQLVLSLRHSKLGGVYHLAFSPDGSDLASGGADGVIRLWDARPLMDSKYGRR